MDLAVDTEDMVDTAVDGAAEAGEAADTAIMARGVAINRDLHHRGGVTTAPDGVRVTAANPDQSTLDTTAPARAGVDVDMAERVTLVDMDRVDMDRGIDRDMDPDMALDMV